MKRSEYIPYVCIVAMISLLLLPLTGCQQQLQLKKPTGLSSISSSVPTDATAVYLPNQSIPADIKLVSAAVSVSVYGEDPEKVSGVRLEQAIEQPRKKLIPPSFLLARHNILQYGQSTKVHQSMTLSGSLDFQDALGRRTILFYDATYRVESKGVVISRCGVTSILPGSEYSPEVIAFTVPGNKMPKDTHKIFSSFEKLYRFAAKNAIPMGKPKGLSGQDNRYYVFAFVLDRISPTASIRFMVDNTKTKSQGYSDASRYYDYDGWRVAILSGTFKLIDEKPLYFKLSYKPGTELSTLHRYERQIAMFGTFDRESLRKTQSRPDLSILLPFKDAAEAPIDPKLKNLWVSAIVKYPEVSGSTNIFKGFSAILKKEEKGSKPERMIPYIYTINSRGSLLVMSVDSKQGALWLSFFPAKRMITDVPLQLQIGNSSPIDLQQYLVGTQGTDLTRYRHMGNVVHYRLYAGIQAPADETLVNLLIKGAQVKVKYATQSKTMEDTFSLKGSGNAIKTMLNSYTR